MVVDALSRQNEGVNQLWAISIVVPNWMIDAQESYEGDEEVKGIISELAIDKGAREHYTL